MLWLDAYVANVDRTWRNPNLPMWHGRLWAIDHGAALYFHDSWPNGVGSTARFAAPPYDVSQHVLVAYASAMGETHEAMSAQVDDDLLSSVVDLVPADWIEPAPASTASRR